MFLHVFLFQPSLLHRGTGAGWGLPWWPATDGVRFQRCWLLKRILATLSVDAIHPSTRDQAGLEHSQTSLSPQEQGLWRVKQDSRMFQISAGHSVRPLSSTFFFFILVDSPFSLTTPKSFMINAVLDSLNTSSFSWDDTYLILHQRPVIGII